MFTAAVGFWRRAASGYAKILTSIMLTIIIAEILLRVFLGPRFYASFKLHERYLYTLTPGVVRDLRHREANGGHVIRYRVNGAGFRGPEFDICAEHYRVVVYGDSFIHAEFSELSHTFVKRLEAQLSVFLEEPVEVVNVGVNGYGPDQILRAHRGVAFRPLC
ncbi:MAG: hypothetical protein JJU27_19450 [Gammaproteobacteria bacterium]|nr:hypothetical protein [Gammaproteobacteria bacterium]